jgi:hypothetical protein
VRPLWGAVDGAALVQAQELPSFILSPSLNPYESWTFGLFQIVDKGILVVKQKYDPWSTNMSTLFYGGKRLNNETENPIGHDPDRLMITLIACI